MRGGQLLRTQRGEEEILDVMQLGGWVDRMRKIWSLIKSLKWQLKVRRQNKINRKRPKKKHIYLYWPVTGQIWRGGLLYSKNLTGSIPSLSVQSLDVLIVCLGYPNPSCFLPHPKNKQVWVQCRYTQTPGLPTVFWMWLAHTVLKTSTWL